MHYNKNVILIAIAIFFVFYASDISYWPETIGSNSTSSHLINSSDSQANLSRIEITLNDSRSANENWIITILTTLAGAAGAIGGGFVASYVTHHSSKEAEKRIIAS